MNLQTFWQKEKLLIVRNFSICHNKFFVSSAADVSKCLRLREGVFHQIILLSSVSLRNIWLWDALTLSHLQKYSDQSAADIFWKHYGKCRVLQIFALIDDFKVIFCRLKIYWSKTIWAQLHNPISLQQTSLQPFSHKHGKSLKKKKTLLIRLQKRDVL